MLLITIVGIIIAIIGLRILKNPPGVFFAPTLRLWGGGLVFVIGLILACFSPLIVLLWQQYHGG